MAENLALWEAVERTPESQTKPITGKSYKGNSPKPHHLVKRATEMFGPCGIGWGFTVEERIEDGAMIEPGFFEKMHVAKVRVWFKWNGERGEVEHIGGTMFSGRYASGKLFTDEDAPKKSVTDALVKALSMIGFAGDIFLGRYDDSKYLSELKAEERQAKADEPKRQFISERASTAVQQPAALSTLAEDMIARLDGPTRMHELITLAKSAEWQADIDKLSEADKQAVRAAYGKTQRAIDQAEMAMVG